MIQNRHIPAVPYGQILLPQLPLLLIGIVLAEVDNTQLRHNLLQLLE